MPRRPRTPAHRIESGLLSPDQLRIESERWQSLVHRYLGFYSNEQKPQVAGLVRDWAVDLVRNSFGSAPNKSRIYDAASPRMSGFFHSRLRLHFLCDQFIHPYPQKLLDQCACLSECRPGCHFFAGTKTVSRGRSDRIVTACGGRKIANFAFRSPGVGYLAFGLSELSPTLDRAPANHVPRSHKCGELRAKLRSLVRS